MLSKIYFVFDIFHVILLNQSTQNLLFFNFLTNLFLLTLAYAKIYTNMRNFLTAYINQNEFFLLSFLKSSITCHVLKIAWVANGNNLSVILRYFILITTYVATCLKTKTLLRATQRTFFFLQLLKNLSWKSKSVRALYFLHCFLYF